MDKRVGIKVNRNNNMKTISNKPKQQQHSIEISKINSLPKLSKNKLIHLNPLNSNKIYFFVFLK